MRTIIICENCPCMNNDYEQGESCNLGYDISDDWFNKKTGEIVKDTPKMRKHQEEFESHYYSKNCELISIETEKEKIKPKRILLKEREL